MKTGRNEPCPCGSGKKYKRCCLSVSNAVSDELSDFLSDQNFGSLEEVEAEANSLTEEYNQIPREEFLGLSSEQVYRMLSFSFDTPDVFHFSEQLTMEPNAPIIMLIEGITSAIDEKGLLATKARGSLPQKLCRKVWEDYRQLSPDDVFSSFHKVNKEDDFFELHVVRIVLELAGFLRKTKGRFYLTKKYQKIMNTSGLKGLYPIILKTYCRKFNWSYWDHYNEIPFIQQSFLFTLYLLQQYGAKMTSTTVYEDDFLRAFPMLTDEMEESLYSTQEEDLRHCYASRTCKRFLVFLGFVEQEAINSEKRYNKKYKIKKTPLFDDAIQFNFTRSKPFKKFH